MEVPPHPTSRPTSHPYFIDSFPSALVPGTVLTFSVTGAVNNAGGVPPNRTPDGRSFTRHSSGDENGISSYNLPINSLVGVFLTDELPTENPAPGTLDFSANGNVEGGIQYRSLAPELQQTFFIGDGVTDDGFVQEITIPQGATRLFLGTSDGFGWFNNDGIFEVEITATFREGEATRNRVFLDQNQNGLFDADETSAIADIEGNFSFAKLASGTYYVRQLPSSGLRQKSPESTPVVITLDEGELVEGLLFENETIPVENTDPLITSQPPESVTVGELFEYRPIVEELDGQQVQFDLPLARRGAVVNPSTGTVRWTPKLDQVGKENFLLRVRDELGGYDLQYFEVEVLLPNTAPVITSSAPTGPAGVGLPFQYKISAVDADGDSVAFRLVNEPEGMSIDALTGELNWTPVADQIGVNSVTVVVTDARGLTAERTYELDVETAPANDPPVFVTEPPKEARLGDPYLYVAMAVDQNGDPILMTLEDGPDGMTLSPEGLLSWQPSAVQLGENSVELKVDDGRGGTAVQKFVINVETQPVNLPPTITSPPNNTAIVDVPYQFAPTADDPNGDTLIWSLESAPIGMSIDAMTGSINWLPTIDDLGEHEVILQVSDPLGAATQLVFKLRVRSVNTPPVILSNPPTIGAIGTTYLYQVISEDPDGDLLAISLDVAPEGMTIEARSGLIQWTPGANQDGEQDVSVTVTDSAGASISQDFTIVVNEGQPNQLPVVTSTPEFFTSVGETYGYQVDATDPDGDELTFELRQAPGGMTIDVSTGFLEWTPTVNDLGTTIVELIALDPAGAGSIQQFSLTVLESNSPPEITSEPPTTLASGQPFRYDVLAADDNSDFLFYELIDGPEGMLIDGLGRMFWVPTADQFGTNPVSISVSDGRGGVATQEFEITVESDTLAPQIAILFSNNPVNVGDLVDIRVQAIDNVGVDSLLLTLDGEAIALDANGFARVKALTVGSFTAVATATDAAGNTSSTELELLVSDPNDVEGPVVSFLSPSTGGEVTAPTEIIGTVLDDTLVSYRLSIAEFGSSDFREIASGTENVDASVLGQLDPTLLQNGSYVLRLEAFDAGGNGNTVEQIVEVTGALKLGNFAVTFSDLLIPVNGFALQFTRTYDTLDANKDAGLGFGWNLEYRDTNLKVSLPESGLEDAGIYTPFAIGTKVYLQLPGQDRIGFTFDPTLTVLPGVR